MFFFELRYKANAGNGTGRHYIGATCRKWPRLFIPDPQIIPDLSGYRPEFQKISF